MSDTHHAGRYVAKDRGAFDAQQQTTPEPMIHAATCTVFEAASIHLTSERLLAFWRWYGELA